MKKCIYALVLAGLMLLSDSCSDRSSLLKVYNWADYIDETVLDDFEVWYQEQTGEAITVVYQTFDINETMLSRIEKGQEDYDVVCPSEYIIERMMAQNLLLPIQRDFGSTPNDIDQNLSPFIVKSFEKVNCGDKRALDYTVPYMWGTTGILYNAKYVSDQEASSWDILVNPKFYDKIFVKDACRDV
ncbi:MAG: extracellular solute-binding protein, partial [Bacteroidales bacterium]|nr:extracellular solute-binding protein [Bacteroidales bacterium]